MGFSRQEHWSGLTLLYPWDLPHPGWNPDLLYFRLIFPIWATREYVCVCVCVYTSMCVYMHTHIYLLPSGCPFHLGHYSALRRVLLGTVDTLSLGRHAVWLPNLTERIRGTWDPGFALAGLYSKAQFLHGKNLQTLYASEITVTKFIIDGKYSVDTNVLFVKVIFLGIKFFLGAQIKWMEIINYFTLP